MRPPALTAAAVTLLAAALAAQAPTPNPYVHFTDVAKTAGLTFVHDSDATPQKFMVETFGSGVAWIDYDNDGAPDLFFTNGRPSAPNGLYHNNRDGTFTDVTARAGVAGTGGGYRTGVAVGDIDNDGDEDLYVTAYGPNVLYRNNGDGTFTDVSKSAGIANPAGKGLGIVVCDIDGDGWDDVYVANDLVRNFLYRNNGDGTFKDISYGAGVGFDANGKPQAGMGVDCGDLNGDARPELFVTNFSEELNTLYENQDGRVFEDVTMKAGLGSGFGPLGFGTAFLDLDNDGDLDIYVINGHVIDNISLYKPKEQAAQRALVYVNDNGHFTDVTEAAGPGPLIERIGRGLAVADYDNDGDLDIAVSNVGAAPLLLRNDAKAGRHWLTIRARGTTSNRDGLGTRVTVTTAAGTQIREINNVASYLSANDRRLHVGLGDAKKIDRLELVWPSGIRQVLTDVAVDRVLDIEEPSAPRP